MTALAGMSELERRALLAGFGVHDENPYADDPVGWVRDRLGEHVWSKQAEIMRSVVENKLTAVQSAHSTGKSHVVSRLVAHFIDTHPVGDVFVVTTAPTSAQVRAILWRYIRQAHRKGGLPGEVMQTAEWKIAGELVGMGRKPNDYETSAFQGIHAPGGVLVVLDEACGVDEQLWNAADALATTDTSRIVAVGNPDQTSSHFHRVCTIEPGWNRIKISAFDTPAFTGEAVPDEVLRGLVSVDWVEDKRKRWGEANPLYQAKVLAEFADQDTGLIPLSWVRAANARWQAWHDAGRKEPPGRRIVGVDPAWMGDDSTGVAVRQGDVIMQVERHPKLDTTQTTSVVAAKLRYGADMAIVDVIGIGAGVYDQLRAARKNARKFNGSQPTRRRDSTGMWKMANCRVAAWWNLRELLDPVNHPTLALPPDDELTADLTTPTWEPRAGGILWIESKEQIKKRLGHSPDTGDAVAHAMWAEALPHVDEDGRQVRSRAVAYAAAPSWT